MVLAVGNATILARGDLLAYLPAIVGVVLVAAAIMPIATAYLSAIQGQVTTTQEIAVVAMASVVSGTGAAFSGTPSDPGYLATILLSIGATTALCGAAMFLLGRARLGRVIRFVPYPVFGGFLAITGWYLFTGGLETIIGHRLDLEQFGAMTEPATALKVGAAIAFVIIVQTFNHRVASGAFLPFAVVWAVIGFNAVVALLGVSLQELGELGWVIRVPASGVQWPPIDSDAIAAIDWAAVGAGLIYAPLVILVAAAAGMMNASGIEIELKGDVDLNQELRSMGVGNVVSGLLGGIPGFPAVSGTLMAWRLGAPVRVVGVIAGLVALVAVVFAQQLLNVVPTPVLGGLLMWLGTSLLIDWVIKPLRTLRRQEHAIILIILAVSIGAGFPAGIATGLFAALVLFVFEYSRVEGVQFAATGRDYQSRMLPEEHRATLEEIGGSIVIMKLSGFIFFGTSDRIIQRIANRLVPAVPEPVLFVVMDFRRVNGIDSSTVMSFDRLRRMAERDGVTVVLAGLSADIAARLRGGIDLDAPPFHIEADLDAAVSWAETQLLSKHTLALAGGAALAKHLGSEKLAQALQPYCTRMEFEPQGYLIEQGSLADDIYFVEQGTGAVVLEAEQGVPVKLMGFGPGTILGEVAFYRGEKRSASAVATTPVVAWQLRRASLERIEAEAPALAAAFHYEIARALADRLQSANRLIRVLAD